MKRTASPTPAPHIPGGFWVAAADPDGTDLPRPKTFDDATLILLETTPEVP